jgi:hypothetical protein
MQEQEIIEGNKLIAEFMGGFQKEDQMYIPDHEAECYKANCLAYDSSWDWLMPVVEKIENLSTPLKTGDNFYFRMIIIKDTVYIEQRNSRLSKWEPMIYLTDTKRTKIKAVWLALVEFIKWYNENNSK